MQFFSSEVSLQKQFWDVHFEKLLICLSYLNQNLFFIYVLADVFLNEINFVLPFLLHIYWRLLWFFLLHGHSRPAIKQFVHVFSYFF